MPACSFRFATFVLLSLALLPRSGEAQQGSQGGGNAPSAPAERARPDSASVPSMATYNPNHDEAPVARAVRIDVPVSIDGNLDEPVWMSAPPVTDFWQYDPGDGERLSEPIEVRFLYDDDALYIGAWISDRDIRPRLARRDGYTNDTDIFSIYIDSYHDHRTAYRFAVNAGGWVRDLIVGGGGGRGGGGGGGRAGGLGGDDSWDPVWEVETRIGDGAWYAEYRIPFSQLRFSSAEEQVWGIQLERKNRPVPEETFWSWTPSTESGGVPRFGHLVGIRGIQPGKRLEILPYFAGRAEYLEIPRDPASAFGNPFRSGSDYFGSAGVDLKYRVTSNFTLDATFNPDFGQVEVDPSVINLTAFETRFQERRPFFVEGGEVFRFGTGGPTLVYSRRIGRPPHGGAPSDAVYSSEVGATTILGAGKLAGKTANGWSLGFLDAVTGREEVSWMGGDRSEQRHEVEPLTNYFAGRARRELRSGQTVIGALITGVNRRLGGSPLAPDLHSSAFSGGIDLVNQWDNRMWSLDAHFSPSRVSGTREAIVSTQRASSRYYQRPDAFRVDSAATSLTGYSASMELEKEAGFYRMEIAGSAVSPGYEVNDLGFQTDAGRRTLSVSGGLEQTRSGPRFRSWNIGARGSSSWNYQGDRVANEIELRGGAQFLNLSRLGLSLVLRPEATNDRLTRGGPLAQSPTSYSGFVNFGTDRRSSLSGGARIWFGGDRAGGWDYGAGVNAAWRTDSNTELRLEPWLGRSYNTAQYLTSEADPTAVGTFGRRYLFAGLHQTTLSLTTRFNVLFTPDISLELYVEPFLSSGRYQPPKELAAPRTFEFNEYGSDVGTMERLPSGEYRIDPDGSGPAEAFDVSNRSFNFRSLLGNAVFRWEWRPGSALFLVWQQSRSVRLRPTSPGDRIGEFDFGHDVRELFRVHPDNIFQIKVNYWLNP
ncbi:MAG: DUF5916 domain-containing protein [Gemmatimonadota bacterium]|nr:DUF5916 domain-containing protein [Gemmatimonadota bacterium]